MSEANGREHSPEFRRGRSGAGTEADAAGAEDTARRKPGSSPCTRGGKGMPAGRCWPGRLWSWGTSHETVKRTLRKRLLLQKESPVPGDSARKRSSWRNKCLKFMRNLTNRPVVCMDGQPVQQGDSRAPLPRTQRVDYERAGTAFMFCEALSSWRRAMARKRRTSGPGKSPTCGRYADCEHPRVRQPRHLHAGSVLRSVLRGRGNWSSEPATRRSTGVG